MRTILAASMLLLVSTAAEAQVNTTGSLAGTAPVTPSTTAQATTGAVTPAPVTTVTPTMVTPSTTTNNATTTTGTTPEATGAVVPTARDAAIILCGQDFSTGGGALLVFSASVSANAPAAAPGASCSQAIADLFAAGFSVIDVQPFNQQLQYTLVR